MCTYATKCQKVSILDVTSGRRGRRRELNSSCSSRPLRMRVLAVPTNTTTVRHTEANKCRTRTMTYLEVWATLQDLIVWVVLVLLAQGVPHACSFASTRRRTLLCCYLGRFDSVSRRIKARDGLGGGRHEYYARRRLQRHVAQGPDSTAMNASRRRTPSVVIKKNMRSRFVGARAHFSCEIDVRHVPSVM